jgi:predicted P-loop ATPase
MTNTPNDKQNTKWTLLPQHLKVMTDRAIPLEYAERCNLRSLKQLTLQGKAALQKHYPGLAVFETSALLIPYHQQLDGIRVARLRNDESKSWSGTPGADETSEEIPRYSAQAKLDVRPYFTPNILTDGVYNNPEVPIAITEAPLKAISLSANGILSIGLGGVEAGAHDVKEWRQDRRLVLNREMDRITWRGRVVPIIYDASITTNPRVAIGAAKTYAVLKNKGALVQLVVIPMADESRSLDQMMGQDTRDQGPDDYLASNGIDALRNLVRDSGPFDPLARVRQAISQGTRDEKIAGVVALLSELPFLAAIDVEGSLALDLVCDAVKAIGIKAKTIKAAVEQFHEQAMENLLEEEPAWMQQLTRTQEDRVKSTVANAALILSNDAEWHNVLAYDLFGEQSCMLLAPPWGPTEKPSEPFQTGQPLAEQDAIRLVSWLERNHELSLSVGMAHEVLEMACAAHAYHPVRDWLEGLVHDGTARVDNLLVGYAKAENTEYHRLIARWFMIGAVARIYRPGAKVDTMPVLEGEQGKKKSSFLRELFGERWFSDTLSEIGTKDSYQDLRSKWCVEWAEMDNFSKAESSQSKKFLSKSTDNYRPSYGRRNRDIPRQTVFCGTVNGNTYLKDVTGDRRYHPAGCDEFDLEAIKRDRGQLWAEAVMMYKAGVRWWPETLSEKDLCREQQDSRRQRDPWESRFADALRGKNETTSQELLDWVLCIAAERQHRGHETKIGQCMTALGWEKHQRRLDDATREWYYLRPGTPLSKEKRPYADRAASRNESSGIAVTTHAEQQALEQAMQDLPN